MSTTFILADDHAIIRDGLRAILAAEPNFKVVGEANTGRQAVEIVERLCPDIVIMDVNMPDLNGVEATRRIRQEDPKVRIIALSMYSDGQFVHAMFEAGASAYVAKSAASRELLDAVHAVLAHRRYISPEVAAFSPDSPATVFSADGREYDRLTSREREVLQLVAEGKSTREIANGLLISQATVDVHRRNIMRKLGVHSAVGLTRFAIRQGLTSA
jgi:NarL family two-component system response regulator LiaR